MEIPKRVSEKVEQTINGELYGASELLEKPGDFYYSVGGKWPPRTPVINCPFCGVPTAYPQAKVLNFTKEPLTVEKELICAYNPIHKFKVIQGIILPS